MNDVMAATHPADARRFARDEGATAPGRRQTSDFLRTRHRHGALTGAQFAAGERLRRLAAAAGRNGFTSQHWHAPVDGSIGQPTAQVEFRVRARRDLRAAIEAIPLEWAAAVVRHICLEDGTYASAARLAEVDRMPGVQARGSRERSGLVHGVLVCGLELLAQHFAQQTLSHDFKSAT